MTTTLTAKADRLLGAPERRTFKCDDLELRSAGGNSLALIGYASVFDRPYEMYGGPDKGGWNETVDTAAFDETLKRKPDLHLLINHEGMPLARTKSGTLQLSTDKVGLKVEADLDRRDPDVQSLEVKMSRGDMDEMSFAFRTVRHEWSNDETDRRLLELNLDKGDVSVVNFGANPHTSAGLRALLENEAELRALAADDLRAAHQFIGTLLGSVPGPRGMSVAHARRLMLLDA